MKKNFTALSIILVLSFGIISCVSSRYVKKGKQLESMGRYTEASDYFYDALKKDKTNAEAYSGLKRNAQMVLSKKLTEFNKAYNLQQKNEALNLYDDAMNYYNKISKLDISLNFPSYYTDNYNEIKNSFLDEKYFEAMKYMQSENFSAAEKAFNEILKVQNNYKDTKEQLVIAKYEPKYRAAIKLTEQKQYRKAYYAFKEIYEHGNSYKDSFELQKECLEKGNNCYRLYNSTR
jgi:tetratricopeptide (TPR) repeat protein